MTHDANRELDRAFGGDYGISPIRFRSDNPAVRRAIISMRQAHQTPQERHEGLSDFIRAFLVMVLLVASMVALTYAWAAWAMVLR